MKALLLCKRNYTNQDLIANKFGRNYHLPVLLQKAGIDFTVIAADYKTKVREKHIIKNTEFYSVPMSVFSIFGFLLELKSIAKKTSFDIVLASGDSHFGYIGYRLAKTLGVPFVFDVYDQYQSFGTNKLLGMKSMYKTALKKADHVICTSQPLLQFISTFNENVSYIQNGVDTATFKPIGKSVAREELGLNHNDLIVGYFGSMEKMRGIATLIEACKSLKNEFPKLKLLLAGTREQALNINFDWIDYRGVVSQKKIAMMINSCDVVTLPYVQSALIDYGNSCKTAEYLACEVPIITTRVSNFVSNYPGIASEIELAICEPENTQSMQRVLKYQLEHQQRVKAPDNISWEYLADQLKDVILDLVEKRRSNRN